MKYREDDCVKLIHFKPKKFLCYLVAFIAFSKIYFWFFLLLVPWVILSYCSIFGFSNDVIYQLSNGQYLSNTPTTVDSKKEKKFDLNLLLLDAVEHNYIIQSQKKQQEINTIAKQSFILQQYSPIFHLGTKRSNENISSISPFFISDTNTSMQDVQYKQSNIFFTFDQKTRWGSNFFLGFDIKKWNDVYIKQYTFNYKQSLYDNLFGIKEKLQKKILDTQNEIQDMQSQQVMQEELSRIAIAYWDWVVSYQKIQVYRDILDISQQVLDSQKKKYQDGFISSIAFETRRINVENIKQLLSIAEHTCFTVKRQNLFKHLHADIMKNIYIPEEKLEFFQYNITLEKAIENALQNRLDYSIQEKNMTLQSRQYKLQQDEFKFRMNLESFVKQNQIGHSRLEHVLFSSSDEPVDFGVTLSIFFSLGQSKKQHLLYSYKKKVEQARLVYLDYKNKIQHEVTQIYETYHHSILLYLGNKSLAQIFQSRYTAVLEEVRIGRIFIAEFSGYQTELLNSIIQKFDYLYQIKVNEIRLKIAQGIFFSRLLTPNSLNVSDVE